MIERSRLQADAPTSLESFIAVPGQMARVQLSTTNIETAMYDEADDT